MPISIEASRCSRHRHAMAPRGVLARGRGKRLGPTLPHLLGLNTLFPAHSRNRLDLLMEMEATDCATSFSTGRVATNRSVILQERSQPPTDRHPAVNQADARFAVPQPPLRHPIMAGPRHAGSTVGACAGVLRHPGITPQAITDRGGRRVTPEEVRALAEEHYRPNPGASEACPNGHARPNPPHMRRPPPDAGR